MALQNGVIAFLLQDLFYPLEISHFTTTKAPQTITLPPPCLTDGVKHSSSIFSASHVLLCDLNTSNLDLSFHNTFFQSSCPVCVFLPIFSYYRPRDMAFSLQLCLEGKHPGVSSSLLMLTGVFHVLFNEAAS